TDAQGKVRVVIGGCTTNLQVKAVNDSGNSAVNVGDALYFVATDNPPVSKKESGVFIGYALGSVSAGQTKTITVKLKTC
ncbi:MAG: hypothetical protein RMJ39_10395, partial [Deltaproteobacteria bacterium]|nr:hypothetical protein [Deltaproteobacteria bacterium]